MAGEKAYESWLRKDVKNSNKVCCFACNKTIDLNVVGKSALVSHMKDKKHEEYVKNQREGDETTSRAFFFKFNWQIGKLILLRRCVRCNPPIKV